jgi:glycosyltransferase involved in cell wall biosynthesis
MKILLFDWNRGGHHAEFAKTFAAALRPGAKVYVAAPDQTLDSLDRAPVETVSLGNGRPRPSEAADGSSPKSDLANAELDLIEELVGELNPDHLVLLWADPVLRWLLRRPPLPTRVSLYLFFAQLHYPRAYRTHLPLRELAGAIFKEASVIRWLYRQDAHALFGFDPIAAKRWAHYPRANTYYLPEPPLNYQPRPCPPEEKEGCVMFGYLDARKGLDRIADALEPGCEGLELRLNGEVAPEYREQLQAQISRIGAAGAEIETRLERLPYEDALDDLAAARVALLAFGWAPPGSRVLLEAASAGTPVVGSSKGAVGHLIREHGLGRTADPADPAAMREAILGLAQEPDAPARYADNLRRYADRLNANQARAEIRRALGLAGD